MKLIVVEEGDYEQRGIVCVATSREAAVAHIKSEYGEPYIVKWDEPTTESLVGHFEGVAGYSTRHTAVYDFTEYDLIGD